MISTAQLNAKLTELNIEFRKVVDSGNAVEVLRWILTAEEFIEALYAKAPSLDLSGNERETLMYMNCGHSLSAKGIKELLTLRLAREAALR